MRKLYLLATSLGFAAVSSATAQVVSVAAPVVGSTVVNFESLALGAAAAGAFTGFGVTVSGGCFLANSFASAGFGAGNTRQAGNFSVGNTACAAGTANQPVTLTFASSLNYFGLVGVSNSNLDPVGPGRITLTNVRGAVTVLTTDFFNGTSPAFVGFTDALGFNSVTISADVNGAFGVDNISFRSPSTSVPEPSTVVLFVAGLLGVWIISRRKHLTY